MSLNKSENIRATLEEKSLERGTTMKGKQRQRTGQTTDKFLRAIQKYAKKQNSAMRGEVKQIKTERLKEAEERGKRDSARLIGEKNQEIRSRHTALLATKTQEGQRKLFVERSRMVEEIFAEAQKKLIDYTATDAYTEKLLSDAREIGRLKGDLRRGNYRKARPKHPHRRSARLLRERRRACRRDS